MKKLISIALVLCVIASMFTFNVFAAEEIKVTIDGKAQNYDVMPVIENGRTLVPMRAIFEALGAVVSWDDATKTVFGTKGDMTVVLQIGNKTAHVNAKAQELDVAATIVDSRTMVPVRFISESLGCNVDWDDSTKTVIINSQSKKLAELVSTLHRNVTTTFEKSNDMKDMYYFAPDDIAEQEKQYAEVKNLVLLYVMKKNF